MKKLLRDLGFEPGEDLETWMSLAQAIQDQRRENGNTRIKSVTRGTALYAAALMSPDLFKLLESEGLDWDQYRESKGIDQTAPGVHPTQKDVNLHKNLEVSLMNTGDRFHAAGALSARFLLFMIIDYVALHPETGSLPKRLREFGLDIDSAQKQFFRLAMSEFATSGDETEKKVSTKEASVLDAQAPTGLWIFRADISQYSLDKNLFPGKTERWEAVKDPGVKAGNLVWCWQDGDTDDRGLYGWGRVTDPLEGNSIPVVYVERFEPDLRADSLATIELALTELISNSSPTFMPITEQQSAQLESVLMQLGSSALPSYPSSGQSDEEQSSSEQFVKSTELSHDPDFDSVITRISTSEIEESLRTALLWAERNDESSHSSGYLSASGVLHGILNTRSDSPELEIFRDLVSRVGARIEEPSFSEVPSQPFYLISPELGQSLSMIRNAFPDHRADFWMLPEDLITAVLYTPERILPDFASNRDELSSQWRVKAQNTWESIFRERGGNDMRVWTGVFQSLRWRYKDFEKEDPAYAENQVNPVESSGTDPGTASNGMPLAWVESDAVAVIGRDNLQSHGNCDSLNAKTQADIFSTLLIAKEVEPPFAIGLLGDWGVGKTFFMRLMQEKIESIAGKDAEADANAESLSRVAQIEFNAWHFVDSDLWASLASHLFDGLSNELRGQGDSVESVRRKLRKRIRSSEREQEEAKAAIFDAQRSRKAAAQQIAEYKVRRSEVQKKCETSRLIRVWDAVMCVKPEPGNSKKQDWPDLEAIKDKAQAVANDLGMDKVIDSAESAQQVCAQLKDIQARGSALMVVVSAAFTGWRALLTGVLIALVVVLVVAMPTLLDNIAQWVNSGDVKNSPILEHLLQVVTVVGAILAWVSRNLRKVSSGLGYLEAIQREIRFPRNPPVKPTQEEVDLRNQLQNIDVNIATEEHRLEEADRQIAEAQAEIQRIDSGGLVYDFLEGRVRDSRYLDRLGLISVIRQDFEQLADLLQDWRTHGSQNGNAAGGKESAQQSWDTRPIERIILYIDDLDRCPPERVVEVLQAVHLILAFKLFVVVVAVDPRWLERSLNEQYNPRLPIVGEQPTKDAQYRFSAQNYLEKIFQIPFSLPTMDVEGYQNLVSKMTNQPKTLIEPTLGNNLSSAEVLPESDIAEKSSNEGNPDKPELQSVESEVPVSLESTDEISDSFQDDVRMIEVLKAREQILEVDRKKREQEEVQKRIAAMLLNNWEEQFISALFPFIVTPRIAKRFVNIYRLLRVRAAQDDDAFEQFLDREKGEYRAVLMLLAINVGFPDAGPQLLEDIGRITRQEKGFQDWLLETSQHYQNDWSSLYEGRIERNAKSGLALPPSDKETQFESLSQSGTEIHKRLGFVMMHLNKIGDLSLEDDLGPCCKWSRDVGRYSFGWHLKWTD